MNILIVEDEVLLAWELESELEAAGHRVLAHAMSSKDAVTQADALRPDLAFVDIHLQDGPTGVEVGRYLASIGIPYVFMTGNLKRVPEDLAGALGVIEKPYSVNGLRNAVAYLARRVGGLPAGGIVPPSLIVSLTTA